VSRRNSGKVQFALRHSQRHLPLPDDDRAVVRLLPCSGRFLFGTSSRTGGSALTEEGSPGLRWSTQGGFSPRSFPPVFRRAGVPGQGRASPVLSGAGAMSAPCRWRTKRVSGRLFCAGEGQARAGRAGVVRGCVGGPTACRGSNRPAGGLGPRRGEREIRLSPGFQGQTRPSPVATACCQRGHSWPGARRGPGDRSAFPRHVGPRPLPAGPAGSLAYGRPTGLTAPASFGGSGHQHQQRSRI